MTDVVSNNAFGELIVPGQADETVEETVRGFLDAADLAKMSRADLEALATEMGISDASDKNVFPNIAALADKLATIPVEAPAEDDEAGGDA